MKERLLHPVGDFELFYGGTMVLRVIKSIIVFIVALSWVSDAREISTSGRVREAFIERVDRYIQQANKKLAGENDVLRALQRITLLTPQSSMAAVAYAIGQLDALGSKIGQDAVLQGAYCAAMLKVLAACVENMRQEIFSALYEIDQAIEYWEYQRLHPVSYFFNKVPTKHITTVQLEEIEDAVQRLREERLRQFVLLGNIAVKLDSFEGQKTVDEQYTWMSELCAIANSWHDGTQQKNQATALATVRRTSVLIRGYVTWMHRRLSLVFKPSFFVRQWLYLFGAAGAIAYKAPQFYRTYASGDLARRVHTVWQNLHGAGALLWNNYKTALFGDERDEEILARDYGAAVHLFRNIGQENLERAGFNDLWNDLSHEDGSARPNVRIVLRMLDYLFQSFAIGTDRLIDAAGESAHDFRQPAGWVRNAFNYQGILTGLSTLMAAFRDLRIEYTGAPVGERERGFISGFALVFRLLYRMQAKEHRMLWAIIYSIPPVLAVYFAGWSLIKIYKKLCGVPQYDSVRATLVAISLLLNMYEDAQPKEMEVADVGHLLYLIHKIQLQKKFIPKQYQEEFMHDTSVLKSSDLHAAQKLRVIDALFKKYPFLSQSGMATA